MSGLSVQESSQTVAHWGASATLGSWNCRSRDKSCHGLVKSAFFLQLDFASLTRSRAGKYWSHLAPCGRDPGLRSSFNPLLRVSARLLAAAADEARAGRFCFHEIMLPTLAASRGWPIYWLSVDSDGYSGRFRPVFPDSELTILLRPHWGPGDARIAHPVKHWPHAFYPRPPLGVAVP